MRPDLVVPPVLGLSSVPAAVVLRTVRSRGPITRDEVVSATDVSASTVNRAVASLTANGILCERPELVASGGIGRPKVPLSVDRQRFAVIGLHIGARATLIVAADLLGRVLTTRTMPTPTADDGVSTAAEVAAAAKRLATAIAPRTVIAAGVACGGQVDPLSGVVDYPQLGLRASPIGATVADALGVRTSVCGHVEAVAAAEVMLTGISGPGLTMLFYARETAGMALVFNSAVVTSATGSGTAEHIPVRAEPVVAEAIAPLGQVLGQPALEAAAVRLGIPVSSGRLADAQASALGQAIAVMRDAINPDRIVVAGQAFTRHPDGLAPVQAACDAASRLPPRELIASAFGHRVQEHAAVVVSLGGIYADPVEAVK